MYRQVNKGGQGKQVTGFSQSRRDKEPKTPNISYQDLFAYYDFGDGNSYSGGGTTVNDLSVNGYTATLVNTPTYSNVYNGVETFNATNTRAAATVPVASTSALTFIAFIKRNGTAPNYAVITNIRNNTAGGADDAGLIFSITANRISYIFGTSVNNYNFNSNLTVPLNQWCMVAAAIDLTGGTLYLNNLSTNNTQTNIAINNGLDLVVGGDIAAVPGRGANCDIGLSMVYRRKLTQSEIKQIFEAYRQRFGI
jgi:hypothetical protein